MTPMVYESTALREAKGRVRALADKIQGIFDEAGPDLEFSRVRSLTGDTRAKLEAIRAMNKELDEAHDHAKLLEEAEGIARRVRAQWEADNLPAGGIPHPQPGAQGRQQAQERRTLGQLFVASPEYKEQRSRRQWATPAAFPDLDIRATVFRTGAGWDPQDIRLPRIELDPQRPIRVVDWIPMLPTSQSAIAYMEETTFTNNAAETAESTATTASDLIGEAALALTERTQPVEWLPVFLPVTMQQMEDVEGIEAYVDSRLIYMLRARLDSQCLNGNGTTPNLKGTANVSGINTQAKGTDPITDAIYKIFRKIRAVGFAEPSVLFTHPNDWEDVRLLRTADGVYIMGSPTDPGPDRIWGVPVQQTTAATENTMIAGDYAQFSALYTKRGITLAVSDSHSSYFTRGMLAIRADMRVAMVHFRPEAFGTVTGA